jgi:hypothetical protein
MYGYSLLSYMIQFLSAFIMVHQQCFMSYIEPYFRQTQQYTNELSHTTAESISCRSINVQIQ